VRSVTVWIGAAARFAHDNVGPGPKKSFIFIAILPRFCDISAE
jgi:hypothetical protein